MLTGDVAAESSVVAGGRRDGVQGEKFHRKCLSLGMYSDFSSDLTYGRKHLIIIYEIWELLISKSGSVP